MTTEHIWQYPQTITTWNCDTGLALGALNGGSTPGSGAFPAANDAIYIPVPIKFQVRVRSIYWINGNTATGNVDAGIYTKAGGRIYSTGSTAQTGTSTPQWVNMTDFVLGPGMYYLAIALSSSSGTLQRQNAGINNMISLGCAKQASAFPLPATATFATITASYLPAIALEIGNSG